MYNTMLGVDVPVSLLARLDEMARARQITRSALVRGALAKFAGVVLAQNEHPRSDRDGQEVKALAIMKANPDKSIARILDLFKEAGIRRGHNWASAKRRELLSTHI